MATLPVPHPSAKVPVRFDHHADFAAYLLHLQITNLRERISLRRDCIGALRDLYAESFAAEHMVEDAQFHDWLSKYGFSIVVEAIEATATMFRRWDRQLEDMEAEGLMTTPRKTKLDLVRYASAVMRNRKESKRLAQLN